METYEPDFSNIEDLWKAGQAWYGPWHKLNVGRKLEERHKVLIEIRKADGPLDGPIQEIREILGSYMEDAELYEEENDTKFEEVIISYSEHYSHYPETEKEWAVIGKRDETDDEIQLRLDAHKIKVESQAQVDAKKQKDKEKKEKQQYERLKKKYAR